MGDARKAALSALEKCRRQGAWSDAVLGSVMEEHSLDSRDRGLAAALCYGVIQNRTLLDCYLAEASAVKLGKVEPKVLDILRVSAYQLLMMDKIPDSAAVNEAVSLTKSLGFTRAAGYVNAVLRRIAGGGVTLTLHGTSAERLSVEYSHPVWLTEYLMRALGEEETRRFLQSSNTAVPLTVQVNTLKTDAKRLLSALRAEGAEAEAHPYLQNCLMLHSTGNPASLQTFREGLFYVQDAAAKMAVLTAAPTAGMKIFDACAAPGGKSFAAAILSGGEADITACDLHENKLKRIRESTARLGLDHIRTMSCDARVNRAEWNGVFDLVIADVPCSGLGVIRKKPDIRWKDPAGFDGLPAIQLDILRNVSCYVKSGGTLLYSTCTVRKEENSDVIAAFLTEHGCFSAEDFIAADGSASTNGCLQLWPQRSGTDGFFIAKLRKND